MHNNLTVEIEARLPGPVIRLVRTVGRTAARCGFNSYLVGGIVRDILLNRPPADIDIMVDGDAVRLAGEMARQADGKLTIHKAFGTATFKLGNYRVDLSTCRSETYDRPGALPKVKPGDIRQDLFRRDFSINALAICINPGRFGLLIDYYGGSQDLKDKLIRISHAKSFQDDATRIMRAVRYEQRLDFKLEHNTLKLLRRDLEMLDTISSDRLKREVMLWLGEAGPGKIVRRASQMGILPKLHPALKWNRPMQVAFSRSAACNAAGNPVITYFCLLVYQLGEDALYELLLRLNLLGSRCDLLSHQGLALKEKQAMLDNPSIKNSELYFLLRDTDPAVLQAVWLYPNPSMVRKNLHIFLTKLRHVKTLLTGNNLTLLGIKQGPQMGTILTKLLTARLDGVVKTRAEEEKLARRLAGI
jgi:tRNA nucleotidyltransferase (CCA-adding enzyme)